MHQAAAAILAPAQPELSPTPCGPPQVPRALPVAGERRLAAPARLHTLRVPHGGYRRRARRGAGLIAAGPDGAVWVAERNRPRLDRVAADGTVSEFVLPFTNRQRPADRGTRWCPLGGGGHQDSANQH